MSHAAQTKSHVVETTDRSLGQRLILDLRYFCDDGTPASACRTPVTHLPESLKRLLVDYNIGGVILFSENIVSAQQLLTLNYTMQAAMAEAHKPPLFIAVDQEGGRVARLPSHMLTPFAGNLAIGASYHEHGTAFAKNVAQGIGGVLRPLGINTNFAPSIDINSEPKNPVINVRSFGEKPERVAELGESFVAALQAEGVMSAVKHFPGHGDTHVDSHSGLPRVNHSETKAREGDLLPFQHIISSATPPAFVMSAHIQYPALDATTLPNKHGQSQIVPATLSRKILHDILRNQMGYKGLVITDALDMAGIASFFTKEDAVVRAFQAGADIALMPYTIRTPSDIQAFSDFFDKLQTQLKKGTIKRQEHLMSLQRVSNAKSSFSLRNFHEKGLSWWREEVAENPWNTKNKAVEKALADAAITLLYGAEALPLRTTTWLAMMPDTARCRAFSHSVSVLAPDISLACIPLTTKPSKQVLTRLLPHAETIIVGDISPQHAVYELAGLESPENIQNRMDEGTRHDFLIQLMQSSKQQNKQIVFVPMRMPYVANTFMPYSDIGIATFSYSVTLNQEEESPVSSAITDALVEVLLGKSQAHSYAPLSWRFNQH